MGDFTARQYAQMRFKIRDYRQGALGLNELIQQLEGLARIVGDDFWCDQVFPLVADLEGINSELIDKRRDATPAERTEIERLLTCVEAIAV